MNVLYTCDDNYVWLMGISAISLFENNRHIKDLTVYLLGENISGENKGILAEIADKYDRSIIIIDVPVLKIPSSLVSARWPLSAFTRLFSGQLLPTDVEKVLYLDCDTIVSGDIEPLDRVRFDENIVCGVKDCISATYKKNIGLKADSIYVNAGVLLFDLKALRDIDINKEIEAYMNKYVKLINYADQDILNGMFKGKIGELSLEYNVMTIATVHNYDEIQMLRRPTNYYSKECLKDAVNKPRIIHFTTNMRVVRPWFEDTNHPLAEKFIYYKKISPWMEMKMGKMIFRTKEAQIIKIINFLPRTISCILLGVIHAWLKPVYIRLRRTK